MYVAKSGNRAPFVHVCCSWVDIWGKVGGGGGVKNSLIINFMSILMQLRIDLKLT